MDETGRIKKEYSIQTVKPGIWTLFNGFVLFIFQQRERVLLSMLKKHGLNDLSNVKILDVGCGTGAEMANMVRYGAGPSNLYGIDLLDFRIKEGRIKYPNMNFETGNAEKLPYPDAFFDIVIQFTVFSSIFDDTMQENISKEMLRVVRSGGNIIWYDGEASRLNHPKFRPISAERMTGLFPGCLIDRTKVTLGFSHGRVNNLLKISWALTTLLEGIKIFNTHCLAVIKKPEK